MPQSSSSVQTQLLTTKKGSESPDRAGMVYLIGAGPGAPGLITLRGAECLGQAEIILYDGLANHQLLELAPNAAWESVGKHGKMRHWSQQEINDRMVSLAKSGKVVARLKGGDPAVFARTAEELAVLAEHKIGFEVVPGITAALACASYAGIPITHRDHASAVALITGQQQPGSDATDIDWEALARFPGTLVFYMAVTTVKEWSRNLLDAGKDPATPAAIIRRCTWPDQQVIRCSLAEVEEQLTPSSKLRPPVTVVVGKVASSDLELGWIAERPLQGRTVMIAGVTNPHSEKSSADGVAGQLKRRLKESGAAVIEQHVLEVQPASDRTSLKEAYQQLKTSQIHGITFSSGNGVDLFMQFLMESADARILHSVTLACVGQSTADRLQRYGLRADVLPTPGKSANAASLLEELKEFAPGKNWIVTTTDGGVPTLANGLRNSGANVLACDVYETQAIETLSPASIQALDSKLLDTVVVTSGRAAAALCAALGRAGVDSTELHAICYSERIEKVLAENNWQGSSACCEVDVEILFEEIARH